MENNISKKIILGCMRIDQMSEEELYNHIKGALELGVTVFDHADIYGGGKCEELFGKVLKQYPELREKMIIQSKCGIRKGFYDLSKDYILESVDGILERLGIDYLDTLILHRPDALMEPKEINEALNILKENKKVRSFGLSNFNLSQFKFLQKQVEVPFILNQLQYSIMHAEMVSTGIQANTMFKGAVDRDGSFLNYAQENNIKIQAWSPFQFGFFEGPFIDHEKFPELNSVLEKIGKRYNVSKSSIAVAWILRYPVEMEVVAGTTNLKRLEDICEGTKITLSREEWYEIFRSAGNILP